MENKKFRLRDEELLKLAREKGSSSAFDELLKRYKGYSGALAREFTKDLQYTGIGYEDVEQIGLLAFQSAYKKVKLNTTSFYLYFKATMKHMFLEYLDEYSYKKGGKFFAGDSLNEDKEVEASNFALRDIAGREDEMMKKDLLKDDIFLVIEKEKPNLTSNEVKVILLYLQDKSFKQIAKKMNYSESHVRYLYSTCIEKLKNSLNK